MGSVAKSSALVLMVCLAAMVTVMPTSCAEVARATTAGDPGPGTDPVPTPSISQLVQMLQRTSRQLERANGKRNANKCELLEKLRSTIDALNRSLKAEYPRDCSDAYLHNCTQSGVYTVRPDQQNTFQVYCDMDLDILGGQRGWTVFQKRSDASENFNRGWSDYEKGFGQASGEFWLGLEKIYRLIARADNTKLYINMTDIDNTKGYVYYNSFSLGPRSTNYSLSVKGYAGENAADVYHQCSNVSFVVPNAHLSADPTSNCTDGVTGGWWTGENGQNGEKDCGKANLNTFHPKDLAFTDCLDEKHGACLEREAFMNWHSVRGDCYKLRKDSAMMLYINRN